jgi:hypothetical protein
VILDVLQERPLDLKKSSPFVYVDMPAPALLRRHETTAVPLDKPPSGVTRVDRVVVDAIEWQPNLMGFQLFMYVSGQPLAELISVTIESGKLVIHGPTGLRFESRASHRYLNVRADGNDLILDIKDVTDSPILAFVEASLPTVSVMMTDRGRRLRVDVIATKRPQN